MKKMSYALIKGISKKNNKEYVRFDLIFDLGDGKTYRHAWFPSYIEQLLLDIKPEDCKEQ